MGQVGVLGGLVEPHEGLPWGCEVHPGFMARVHFSSLKHIQSISFALKFSGTRRGEVHSCATSSPF